LSESSCMQYMTRYANVENLSYEHVNTNFNKYNGIEIFNSIICKSS